MDYLEEPPPHYTDLEFSNHGYVTDTDDATELLPNQHPGAAQTQQMQHRDIHTSQSDTVPAQHVQYQPWNVQSRLVDSAPPEHILPESPPPYTHSELSNPSFISDNYDVMVTSHPPIHDTETTQHVQQLSCDMWRQQTGSHTAIVSQPNPRDTSIALSAVAIPELMMFSIFTLLCCNPCLGLYAILRTFRAKKALEINDYQSVKKHSRAAKSGIYLGLILGIFAYTMIAITFILALGVN